MESPMSMQCQLCTTRYALSSPQPNAKGELVFMCIACAAQHSKPRQFAEGTMQPVTDFARHEPFVANDNEQELSVATARAEAAIDCLRSLVRHWRKEMRGGYATPEMQWALRRAEEMVK
jgi:hypothetical protein